MFSTYRLACCVKCRGLENAPPGKVPGTFGPTEPVLHISGVEVREVPGTWERAAGKVPGTSRPRVERTPPIASRCASSAGDLGRLAAEQVTHKVFDGVGFVEHCDPPEKVPGTSPTSE